MAETYRVVVVDDHPLFRRGVVQLLGMNPIFPVFYTFRVIKKP